MNAERARVASLLCLALSVGCRRDRDEQAAAAASAPAVAPAAPDPAVAAASAAQALASAVAVESQAKVEGNVHSAGGGLGTWDIELGDCRSGESSGFYGVDFFVAGDKNLRLRYVHDEAKGEVVKVVDPSKKDSALVLDRSASCSVLEGAVEKTNFQTWTPKGKIRHLEGHVKFDCKHAGGKGRVRGEAVFSHCH